MFEKKKSKKEAQQSLKKNTLHSNHEQQFFLHSSNEQKGLKRSYGNPSRDIFNNISPNAAPPTYQNNHSHNNYQQFENMHIINNSKKLINQGNGNKSTEKSKSYSIYDYPHHAIRKTNHNDVVELKVHPFIDDDDDDDDKLVKPFDYSLNSSSSTSSFSSSSSSLSSLITTTTTTTTTGSTKHKHHTRAFCPTKFEQINRNIIRHIIVKNIMQEVHDRWKSSNNNENDRKIIPLDATLLIPSIPKVSAQPLWKSLSNSDNKEDLSIRKGLFADIHISEDRFLLEINGEIIVKSSYKSKPSSLYHILHTPEDKTFFYPGLDLMMDSRNCGNNSRVVRRSCYPNAIIKPIILPHNTKDTTIHLGLFSTEHISKSEEICISWQWKRNTLMWELYNEWKNNAENSLNDKKISQQIDHILILMKQQFGDCACADKSECFIEYLKKKYQRRARSPISSSPSTSTSIRRKSLTDNKQQQQQQQSATSRRRSSNSDVSMKDKVKLQQEQRRRSHDLIHSSSKPTTVDEEQNINFSNSKRFKSNNIQKPATDPINFNNETKSDLFFASLPSSKINTSLNTFKASSVSHITPAINKNSEVPMELVASIDKKNEVKETDSFNLSTITKAENLGMDGGTLDINNIVKKWTPNAKLPCKKAWIKSYMATVAVETSHLNVLPEKMSKDDLINNFFSDDDETSNKKK
ncbi:unnamed protein product [Cunninghamella blakesleeana]